ncbi:hypothetical protein [Streptomyces aureoversilis]|uniref:Uncharacterized protein n=1 Tax=Streptomyces aureoversilis TaxID=67277 RepID=A0ABV9ZSB7_9ACTN
MYTIRRLSEGERALCQAERGEIRIGPDAAREIAARHQAAYGDAVWPSDPAEAAWDEAVAALGGGDAS